jgi:hypothetical protein
LQSLQLAPGASGIIVLFRAHVHLQKRAGPVAVARGMRMKRRVRMVGRRRWSGAGIFVEAEMFRAYGRQ